MFDQIETLTQNSMAFISLGFLGPALNFRQRRNSRRMDEYVGAALDQRYRECLAASTGTGDAPASGRAVIDLLLQAYGAGHPPLPHASARPSPSSSLPLPKSATPAGALPQKAPQRANMINPAFRVFATHQIRLFCAGRRQFGQHISQLPALPGRRAP
jgi:hypothetical protein